MRKENETHMDLRSRAFHHAKHAIEVLHANPIECTNIQVHILRNGGAVPRTMIPPGVHLPTPGASHYFVKTVRVADEEPFHTRMRDVMFSLAIQHMQMECQLEQISPLTSITFVQNQQKITWVTMVQEKCECTFFDLCMSSPDDLHVFIKETVRKIRIMHDAYGIAHGDLHTRNIIVREDRTVLFCDFELACSNESIPYAGADTLYNVPFDTDSLILIRKRYTVYSKDHISFPSEQPVYDELHWSHARWFQRTHMFLLTSGPTIAAATDTATSPFRMRFDLDVVMFVASIPYQRAEETFFEQPFLYSYTDKHTRLRQALTWMITGMDRVRDRCVSPHHLFPYLFCAPTDHHVCSVAAHSAREAVSRNIFFPFVRMDLEADLPAVMQRTAEALSHAAFINSLAHHSAQLKSFLASSDADAVCSIIRHNPLSPHILCRTFHTHQSAAVLRALVRVSERETRDQLSIDMEDVAALVRCVASVPGARADAHACAAFLRHLYVFCPSLFSREGPLTAGAPALYAAWHAHPSPIVRRVCVFLRIAAQHSAEQRARAA